MAQVKNNPSAFDRSGGGGGGTKGPAILDKRNVEQDCPYCDRTFKQVGTSLACTAMPIAATVWAKISINFCRGLLSHHRNI